MQAGHTPVLAGADCNAVAIVGVSQGDGVAGAAVHAHDAVLHEGGGAEAGVDLCRAFRSRDFFYIPEAYFLICDYVSIFLNR